MFAFGNKMLIKVPCNDMVKRRLIETDELIKSELHAQMFDKMMRGERDKGWLGTDDIIKTGIRHGLALEIGPGPGYLGLEWLKETLGTNLKAVEISPAMIVIAKKNTIEYDLEARIEYINGDAQELPFDDDMFNGVFSRFSLHEWKQPTKIFNEIYRVLRPGGIYYISDLRRDMNLLLRWFVPLMIKQKEMKQSYISSVNASYTYEEISTILEESKLKGCIIKKDIGGLVIMGEKVI